MKRKIELLAPGGDIDSIKAAIIAGADAIYCGLDKFNARNRAENIGIEELNGILRLAHKNSCEIFLTLNIIIIESEIPTLINLLNKLVNTGLDGIIVQDFGAFYLLEKYFPSLKIHASTQLTSHNEGQIKFLKRLTATRVNLCRELNLNEIKSLARTGHEHDLLTEVFVHGANCICFSGICYLSSVLGGNSGNRGRCSQPCRDQYLTTVRAKNFPLNLKDNSAYADLAELAEAGVDSIKIEGRIKKFHYVHTVVNSWRQQLRRLSNKEELLKDDENLHRVFNRGFSNAFLKGDINRNMFIDNPRDNSALHLAEIYGGASDENVTRAKKELYDLKTEIINDVRTRIDQLSIERAPLTISVSGKVGAQLKVSVTTPDTSFTLYSTTELAQTGRAITAIATKKGRANQVLDYEILLSRFKAVNDTEYFIETLELDALEENLFVPFKELTSLKSQLLFKLNGERAHHAPIDLPRLKKHDDKTERPCLSLLISSAEDIHLCRETSADVYFQLPSNFKNSLVKFIDLFCQNDKLIPWFPSILIGDDYRTAVEFLERVKPKGIVTDNTGIALAAYERGIKWVAGPHLNTVNSFSLLSLKEKFNCSGAFISNEINGRQIKAIKRPEGFDLYYSIYHPILLLTSRQCLFQQITGCAKKRMDESCIEGCEKTASISNLKDGTIFIEKSKGNYHHAYHETHFLNTDIATDTEGLFTSLFIDLRDIETKTERAVDKIDLIRLFADHLNDKADSAEILKRNISPTTCHQYTRGL
ncbi:peptidase U32 family protein [Desulfotalea psychrophila]|uniref:Related to collagenase n=1 Tax=Desulfotalea psychrophila (strain LSv54 / DSM 12343) TaxID=177439 RepID=Q6AJA0_DESPS|nr:peptidase U32 family protein [Desulfotalea psychrophila]CAG37580.1 related to collagenase [Desulfotalea psychrophila LSv54]